jgi:hypothetical protein
VDINRTIALIGLKYMALLPRVALREAGIDWRVVVRRIGDGLIEELSPRVLRLAGTAITDEQRVRAATLDVAGGAFASFLTAAWLWAFPGFPLRGIEVTAARRQFRTSTLAFVHRPVKLLPHHVTTWRGIPVTTVPRTLWDLASVIKPKRWIRLADTVCTRSPAVLVQLHRMLRELGGRGVPGTVLVREFLSTRPEGIRVAPSGYQARFEEVMEMAGITGLRREVDVGGHSWIGRVDYRDDVTGALIEVDSALNHTSPTDVAADAERDAAAVAAGFSEVVRIDADDLYPRPWIVIAAVRDLRSRYANRPDVVDSHTENGGEGRNAG